MQSLRRHASASSWSKPRPRRRRSIPRALPHASRSSRQRIRTIQPRSRCGRSSAGEACLPSSRLRSWSCRSVVSDRTHRRRSMRWRRSTITRPRVAGDEARAAGGRSRVPRRSRRPRMLPSSGAREREPATLAELAKRPVTAPPASRRCGRRAERRLELRAISCRSRTPIPRCGRRHCGASATSSSPWRTSCSAESATTDQAAAVTREAIVAYQPAAAGVSGASGLGRSALPACARPTSHSAIPSRRSSNSTVWSVRMHRARCTREAQFRRGEIFFSDGRYAAGRAGLRGGAAQGSKAPSFACRRCYKHGWSLFKQARDEEGEPVVPRRARRGAGSRRTAARTRTTWRAPSASSPTTRCVR